MKRRDFIILLGGAAAAPSVSWPLAARAQQRAMPVIGVLSGLDSNAAPSRAFRQALNKAGLIEGRNVTIEYRGADDHLERLPALAADLVRGQVKVIVATTAGCAVAAKAATSTIPIVFVMGGDPVALGLVASLSHPGGNITGVTTLGRELGPKRLELIHEMIPGVMLIGVLLNPANPSVDSQTRELESAAQILGVRLHFVHAATERDLDAAFAALLELRAGALVIGSDGFFISRSEQLAALALRHGIPAIFQFREFAAAGGLMSYGSSNSDSDDRLGVIAAYVSRILKGEKPGDLPVQQATRIELIINMKTAKALGLTFPLTLLGRADAVVE